MSTRRITVSVPTDVAARVRRAAGAKGSISAWVTAAVERTLADEDVTARFLAFCDGVKASPEEERRAEASFARIVAGKKTRKAGNRGKTAA